MALYAFIGAGGVKIGSVGWASLIRNRGKMHVQCGVFWQSVYERWHRCRSIARSPLPKRRACGGGGFERERSIETTLQHIGGFS